MKTMHLLIIATVIASVPTLGLAQRSDKVPVKPSDLPPNNATLAKDAAAGEKLQQLGSQLADAKTSSEVRDALVQMVNAATTENGFVDLMGRIAKQDRDRVGDVRTENLDDLHKVIRQFRDDFRARYHQEFSLKPEHLKDANVNLGTVKDSVTVSLSDLEKNPAVPPAPGTGDLPTPLKTNDGMSKDIPAHTGLSMVSGPTINLIREGSSATATDMNAWKVNIPNEITAKQLKQNLTMHLRKLDDQKSTWSDDANSTSRAVAAQVLLVST